ncbi:hypothetical protein AA103196_2418 [Ameyamaea chiangmaiensis NBRC 103196]|uniref:EamA family transporter n=1 Tax=Ameyamaea chiangmaiensis TaxID=442969 RepID=A0A850PG18_9PROT|nr:DMT family transporter [Ameyamaea chiangmaiensis]MBS4075891.1 EamA family transporter [Ameyamaea chiangmaiensis]NVN41783.1 EamA family transporter [Ameyamaea chiangmaiensis]GBQ70197.1 hypothetical protein AA103196_2418 [Ameyamaea chiangmaiensis NBRC 103196]
MRADRLLPLCATVAIVSWASAYPLVRIALRDIPPVPLAAWRYAVAAVLAGLYLLVRRPPVPHGRDLVRLAACGAVGIAAYNILFNCGEVSVSAGTASLIIAAAPLLAGLLAVVVLGERLSARGWAGSVLSFSGVALLAQGQAGGLRFGSGATLVAGAALCAALYMVAQKPLLGRYGALPTTAYTLIAGAVFLSPALGQGARALAHAPPTTWAAVLTLGIFPAALGYAAWGFVIGHLGAARGMVLIYLLPPTTMVLAYGLTGETPTRATLVGGAIVMAGVVLATARRRRAVAA